MYSFLIQMFRKAFEKVAHENLVLHKLYHYGIRGWGILNWIKNFLDNRKQAVVLNWINSDSISQGSRTHIVSSIHQ